MVSAQKKIKNYTKNQLIENLHPDTRESKYLLSNAQDGRIWDLFYPS